MTPSQTCRTCGEARAIDAFKRLRRGNRSAICIPCTKAAKSVRNRRNGEARRATPEYQAKLEQKRLAKAETEAKRLEAIEQEHVARREREAAMRDVVWDAMRTGRYRRAATATRPDPSPVHRIKLANGGGFISIAELACRCVEREATSRAAASCKTYEAAYSAARILERATATLDRKGEVDQLWRDDQPQNTFRPLGCPSDEPEIDEDNLFEEAFGDWAPSWAATAASSWPASRAG